MVTIRTVPHGGGVRVNIGTPRQISKDLLIKMQKNSK
jgi:hypothetical protein